MSRNKFSYLNVWRAVFLYTEATNTWRLDTNLFIQFHGKNKGMKSANSTTSLWIWGAICESSKEIDKSVPHELKTHSTRAVSTSWAKKASASFKQLSKAAIWKSINTFSRQYRLDMMANQYMAFGGKALSSVVPLMSPQQHTWEVLENGNREKEELDSVTLTGAMMWILRSRAR